PGSSPASPLSASRRGGQGVRTAPPRGGTGRRTGINENYARELLELHTLGVDAGYTQQDVINVARIFTGWSIERPQQGAAFQFHRWAHDDGDKVVMGVAYPAGHGMDEGIRLLAWLADQPATMHHVGRELCERFVNDKPPDGCVDDAVAAWQRTGGGIREDPGREDDLAHEGRHQTSGVGYQRSRAGPRPRRGPGARGTGVSEAMSITRRVFVKSGGLALVSLGLDPLFLARAAFASYRPSSSLTARPILVCLFQRGAVDGLNMIVPHGDPQYYAERPRIAVPQADVVNLDGHFGLPPRL